MNSNPTSIQVKTVFVGDQSVGKSSILTQFVTNKFDENIQATSGADFKVKTIQHAGNQVDFQLWDTAGQERFRSLTSMYYKDARVACIVYDISNKNSFQVLSYWLKELNQHADMKVIIGNKIDLAQASGQKTVLVDQAQNIAKQNDALLLFTSAKEGTGIQELFAKIADQVLNSINKDMSKKNSVIIKKTEQTKKKPKCC